MTFGPIRKLHILVAGESEFTIMKKYEYHPLSEIFPLVKDTDFTELCQDIKACGLIQPIFLFEEKILDGRNRYRACLEAGVEPKFKQFKGDALAFVVSANLHRRHMSIPQRAMAAAKIANMQEGRQGLTHGIPLVSQSDAAEKMGVSVDSVKRAKKLLEQAPKKLIKEVEAGEKTINGALQEMQEKDKKKEIVIDKTGCPVPAEILEDWNRADDVRVLMSALSRIRCAVEDGIKDDVIYAELSNHSICDFNNAYTSLKHVVPFAVCPTCSGKKRKGCQMCISKGFLSEMRWKQVVPSEIKAIREKVKR